MFQFAQRIPIDLLGRTAGRKLSIPMGDGRHHHLTLSPKAKDVRFSLRTRDPSVAKTRTAAAAGYLESVWRALRAEAPSSLSHRQATALAGDLYEVWATGAERERTTSVTLTPEGWVADQASPEEERVAFNRLADRLRSELESGCEAADFERVLGSLVDRLLLRRGIAEVDAASRILLLEAFAQALADAFDVRARNASGDYSPDPKAQRFPEWQAPSAAPRTVPSPRGRVSLRGLVESWWREAMATGRKPSTHDSYRNSMEAFVAYLKHDDAERVTPDDVIGFKDHRLATINKRTGKALSPKTVKDSDLAGLKTIFGWAVANRKMRANHAFGITVKVGKRPKLRSKGFTDTEARAILLAASFYDPAPREHARTAAAKRWVPWLCAYTGARVGELAQARKQDLRQEGEAWVLRITPEAGTVKTNEARDVVLHEHLVEMGFPHFVDSMPNGHLFLKPGEGGDVRGPLRGLKNRLAQAARAVVKDKEVAPNHGWRHRFKTVGLEVGVDHRVLDAIQGQSPRTNAESYGEVTVRTMAAAMRKIPRIDIAASPPFPSSLPRGRED